MGRAPPYYMLVASLPYLPPLFAAEKLPMSRERLEGRLAMLSDEDRHELSVIEDLMHWDRVPLDTSDREVVEHAENIIPTLRYERLRQFATWRMEIRTVVAALRRRAAGVSVADLGERWGYGRWVWHIEQNWGRPDFGLGNAVPYIVPFQQLIEQRDALALERAILDTVIKELARVADLHHFDFESVALYVLRWNIIARWTGHDQARAQERFDRLVGEGLGEYADLYAATG
jgi:uncharacterized protein DUF2764